MSMLTLSLRWSGRMPRRAAAASLRQPWWLRLWDAACRHAERADRQVPYY